MSRRAQVRARDQPRRAVHRGTPRVTLDPGLDRESYQAFRSPSRPRGAIKVVARRSLIIVWATTEILARVPKKSLRQPVALEVREGNWRCVGRGVSGPGAGRARYRR